MIPSRDVFEALFWAFLSLFSLVIPFVILSLLYRCWAGTCWVVYRKPTQRLIDYELTTFSSYLPLATTTVVVSTAPFHLWGTVLYVQQDITPYRIHPHLTVQIDNRKVCALISTSPNPINP